MALSSFVSILTMCMSLFFPRSGSTFPGSGSPVVRLVLHDKFVKKPCPQHSFNELRYRAEWMRRHVLISLFRAATSHLFFRFRIRNSFVFPALPRPVSVFGSMMSSFWRSDALLLAPGSFPASSRPPVAISPRTLSAFFFFLNPFYSGI
jgi:hypothetical protein